MGNVRMSAYCEYCETCTGVCGVVPCVFQERDEAKKRVAELKEFSARVFRALKRDQIQINETGICGWSPGDPEPELLVVNARAEAWKTAAEACEQLVEWRDDDYQDYATAEVRLSKARELETAMNNAAGTQP